MSHIRFWYLTLATAVLGAFIAIERFAWSPSVAVWIAFGVAIGVTLLALRAAYDGSRRENQAFSGLSGLNALIGAWTIVAMLVFGTRTAVWLAFADGLAVMLISLRALALHETTFERVVHAFGEGGSAAGRLRSEVGSSAGRLRSEAGSIGAPMRSWLYWLSHVGLMITGGLIVMVSFALSSSGAGHVSERWIAFGVGIGASVIALGMLLALIFGGESDGPADGMFAGRVQRALATAGSTAAAIALIPTMAIYSGSAAKWISFALGAGVVLLSAIALAIHELRSERVLHELEVSRRPLAPSGEPGAGERPDQTPAGTLAA